MNRYVVAFQRDADVKVVLATVSVPHEALVDGCEHLAECGSGLGDDKALYFPEIGVVSMVLSDEAAANLRSSPGVESVRVSDEVTNRSITRPFEAREAELAADVIGPSPWHLHTVKADQCWGRTTGKGVKVGVIDSEIDKDLAYLPIVQGISFHPEAPDWFGTDDFHGTFCAGIIGCRSSHPRMRGVAPECDLYALRVNKGGSGRSEYIAAAMIWAARNNLDVVSLSQWTPGGASDPHEPVWDDVDRASKQLTAAGCVILGISGNSGALPNHWVTNPARCESIIAVGGVKQGGAWWEESSYGPPDLPETSSVEIVAPSYYVYSIKPKGDEGAGAGTSFAAPQIAGAMALIKQLQPHVKPEELRERVKRSAAALSAPGRDEKLGYGLLDCLAAIGGLAA